MTNLVDRCRQGIDVTPVRAHVSSREEVAAAHPRVRAFVISGIIEIAILTFIMTSYALIRAVTQGSAHQALANARHLFDFEQRIGIAWEAHVQTFALHHIAVRDIADWVYIYGHWPLLIAVAIGMFTFRRPQYRTLRNALAISGLIGFAFFALDPTAPPRLAGLGLVDTITQYSGSYHVLQPPRLTNEYASMPSLHFGWDLLIGIALVRHARPLPLRIFGFVMPFLMFFAVIATANHFILDPLVGGGVILASLAVAETLGRQSAKRKVARATVLV